VSSEWEATARPRPRARALRVAGFREGVEAVLFFDLIDKGDPIDKIDSGSHPSSTPSMRSTRSTLSITSPSRHHAAGTPRLPARRPVFQLIRPFAPPAWRTAYAARGAVPAVLYQHQAFALHTQRPRRVPVLCPPFTAGSRVPAPPPSPLLCARHAVRLLSLPPRIPARSLRAACVPPLHCLLPLPTATAYCLLGPPHLFM
jgi:hypothetical protein